MKTLKLFAGILLASLLLSACAVLPGAAPQPTAAPTAAEETPTPNDTPLLPPKAALTAQQMLAERLNISLDEVTIAAVEDEDWSDSCLGLGGANESCLQTIVPGYRVILTANGQEYEYRTDQQGETVRAVLEQSTGGGAAVAGETVRRLLARRLGVDISTVQLDSVEQLDWQDSCLGYGSPVELCAAVLTPGYKVIVKTGGASYEFHTDIEVLRIRNQGGYEEYTALPPAALDEIARQLNAAPAALKITSAERVDWPDSCFGVPPPNRVCITAITPGWRALVEFNGKTYEFRSDMGGTTVIQYTGESSSSGDDASALVWQIEGETCREARFSAEIMRFGVCNAGNPDELNLTADQAKELAFLVETYQSFSAHTPSGTVTFVGQGSQMPTLAQERAFAEWARIVRSTAAGDVNPQNYLLLSWSRQGGFAGFCDTLSVDTAGFARAANCKTAADVEYQPVQIPAKELETLYNWADSYEPFTFTQKDAATADAMSVELQFAGHGRQTVTDDWKRGAQNFAADLYAAVQKLLK